MRNPLLFSGSLRWKVSKISFWMLLLFPIATFGKLTAGTSYVHVESSPGFFPLVTEKTSASICVSQRDFPGVLKVANLLQSDIEKVTGVRAVLVTDEVKGPYSVIIGTIGKSDLIDQLITCGKLDVETVKGRWDMFTIQTVDEPVSGVKQALVIAGSNKRGTIYGMFDLSKKMGVSPWYWWADVPVQTKNEVFIEPGIHSDGEPKIKYRGIFLNDEAPALSGWAKETFGGFNHRFYEKVFELILRNRGNYLWPAMWPPTAFFDDDPENYRLADEMGIVMSTSHHEPMMRSHEEWYRYKGGAWNYETNKEHLQAFWRGGMERMKDSEGVVTVGMRGDGDEAMSENTAVDLLQRIVRDQRQIIEEVTGKPASETPQVWALYKEVQDYYDKGMRVPDDVMVLLCDDNWGNVRILPKREDWNRKGGFGIYYHFDFVGGPVSYRWINVTQIEKVWEQMNLCWQWGVHDLWLVNVGDLKPMELPISFFLDMAWDPEAMDAASLPDYYSDWAAQQFGSERAAEIGEILALQTKFNARRTPEMLKPDTYSLFNYREADSVVEDYQMLVAKAQAIYDQLSEVQKSAFYQLVLFPAAISCNLNEMVVAAGKNRVYAEQGRASANDYAELTKTLFAKDAELTRYFHEELERGKWNHMMSQTHIGYTNWNNPPVNNMPAVSLTQTRPKPGLGISVEMASRSKPMELPVFDPVNQQQYFVEVFNTGMGELKYSATAEQDWIHLSNMEGNTETEGKVYVSIDWNRVPAGNHKGSIIVSGAGQQLAVSVPVRNERLESVRGFMENNGVVSMEASHFSRSVVSDGISWTVVPNLGRTGSSVTILPANADSIEPGDGSPHLEYDFTVWEAGAVELQCYLSPTLNFKKDDGLKFAVSIDEGTPRIVNIHEGETVPDWEYPEWWNRSVTDHVKKKSIPMSLDDSGTHTLKVWMVDPGIVFQKFVINAGGLKESYLGPTESLIVGSD